MPLLWLSLAFLAGVWFADLLHWSTAWWGALALLALFLLVLLLVFRSRLGDFDPMTLRLPNPDGFPASRLPLFLIMFSLAAGGLRYQVSQPHQDDSFIASYNDQGVEYLLQGVVVRPPDQRDRYTLLTIRTEQILFPGEASSRPVTGLALARVPGHSAMRYGDRISVQGELNTPSENEEFSYRDYLARQGIYSFLPSVRASLVENDQGSRLLTWIYSFREKALRTLYVIFPDPEAALLAGILLGIDQGIPEPVIQAFQDSGTAHIIAISGFNMALVAGLFAVLFGRLLGKRKGVLAAMLAIVFYTLLVGAGASVVRAAVMAGMAMLAAQVGRRGNGLNTLAIVAAVMVLFDPQILWDIGFQLSFMATLGLILYSKPLMDGVARLAEGRLSSEMAHKIEQPVGDYLLLTVGALVTTLPITLYYFQRFPLLALPANLAILPAQPAVMILGGLAMLAGMISQAVGQLLAYPAWPFVAYTIRMAEFWGGFQGAVLNVGRVNAVVVWGFYALLFSLTFGLPAYRARQQARAQASQVVPETGDAKKTDRWGSLRAWFEARAAPIITFSLVGLAIGAVLVWRAALAAPDGRLRLTILDVGSGDGMLLQTPGGRSVLIDGGGSPSALANGLGRRMPLGRRRLDLLIVAGTENEQVEALPQVLPRYLPDQVLWSGQNGGGRGARLISEYLSEAQIPLTQAVSGQEVDLGDGAAIKVISANRRGAVLLLTYGNFRALLPVGVDPDALEALHADPRLAGMSVLLLTDGGYAPANPPALIARLNPKLILLSVAAGNRRGLPEPETLHVIEGYPLLRTDQNGWIELTTDGEQMWVEVQRR